MRYSNEQILAAQSLWVRGHSAKDIKDKLGLNNTRIVYYWAKKNGWGELKEVLTPEQATAARFNLLMGLENKTSDQLKELNTLTGILERFAKVKLTKQKAAAGGGSSSGGGDSSGKKKPKKVKNDISGITEEALTTLRVKLFFGYQLNWHKNKHRRTRFVLKSRQVGGTFYCSYEAFEDAVLTGANQVFLSASKKQAFIFKAYICAIAREHFDVELKGGEEIILSNGAKLQFISTNASTSQGYSGNLYVDEVFWIPDFEKLNKVAKPIASQAKWRRTYLSTPSVKEHGAYALWSGDLFKQNSKRKKDKALAFDLTHETLKHGHLGPDNIWRNIVTINDAHASGCTLFNLDELITEYSDLEWRNLFLCEFMDQSQSLFNMLDLIACGVDTSLLWRDHNPSAAMPLGNHPVWIGYDPARIGDQSTVVVVAPPQNAGASFRVIEKLQVSGSYPAQAAQIKPLFDKYRVEYMGVDRTGAGQGVHDEIAKIFPRVDGIYYTHEKKAALVLKAQSVIELKRLEWSIDDKDLAQAFLQIKQVSRNDRIFYEADRNAKTGHADYAFAIMNALANEPLAGKRRRSSLTIQH